MNSGHIRRAMLSVVIVGCCTVETAANAGADTDRNAILNWSCLQQHDESFNVRCTPRLEGTSPGTFSRRWAALFWEDIIGQPPAARYAAGISSRRRDFRPVAMRYSDEIFSGAAWYVPLHSRPTDAANVIRALQSALCGTMRYCRVTYGLGGSRRDPED